jgi:ribosome-associated translation inhibitor RaiA
MNLHDLSRIEPTRCGLRKPPLPAMQGAKMQVQVNTDKHIDGSTALTAHVEAVIERTLRHVRDHVTRVEVHLSDENAGKAGVADKRCLIEARRDLTARLEATQ